MAMFHISEARINIGVIVTPKGVGAKSHGTLMVNTVDSKTAQVVVSKVDVVLDRPDLIHNGLNYFTWRRLKKQIQKMGLVATHLELTCTGEPVCYSLEAYKQVYWGARQGSFVKNTPRQGTVSFDAV
jgi:hypothetical protein